MIYAAPSIRADRATWWLIIGCAAPILLISACIAVFGVDVLFWDEFIMWARLLEAMERHGLQLADLFAQQNEQRNAAARIVGLALLPWFRLSRLPELYVIVLLSGAGWLALCGLYARTRRRFQVQGQRWVYACFAWLTFSTVQWQVFTVGVNTAIVTSVACLLAGAWLLAGSPGPLRFLLALLVGYAGSFNFANGLFYWICLPIVLLAQESPRRSRLVRLMIWLLAGAGAWALYFHGYVKPGHHPDLGFGLTHPHVFIAFFLTYLGGPLAMDNLPFAAALTLGLGGVVFLAVNLAYCRRAGIRLFPDLAPWAAILLFALLSDLATSVGRAGFGIQQQALQSRYAAFANLFWAVASSVPAALAATRAGRVLGAVSGLLSRVQRHVGAGDAAPPGETAGRPGRAVRIDRRRARQGHFSRSALYEADASLVFPAPTVRVPGHPRPGGLPSPGRRAQRRGLAPGGDQRSGGHPGLPVGRASAGLGA